MNLQLKRTSFELYGIFGELLDESGNLICLSLEHSYANQPKLPVGTYECMRGMHKLDSHPAPLETFQIMDVPGHTDILFHRGNTQNDSEGCVLLGMETNTLGLSDSKEAFDKFMNLQAGSDSFTLIVS